jgi:hypothetical protein
MLEVLLAMAIIAILMTVFIGGSAALLKSRAVTPSEVFWKTVQECRKRALKTGKDVRLTFDTKEKKFVVNEVIAGDAGPQQFPIPGASDELAITFLVMQKGGSAMLLGGVLVETQTIPAVNFYSDGTCTPFRLQIVKGIDTSVLSIDPWTCAPVLTPTDSNTL